MILIKRFLRKGKEGKRSIWRQAAFEVCYTLVWLFSWYFFFVVLEAKNNTIGGYLALAVIVASAPDYSDLLSLIKRRKEDSHDNDG